MEKIKEYIDKYAALLPMTSSISVPDAERRASDFLVVQAQIANYRHILTHQKILSLSVQNAVYAESLSKCSGKTITENKLTVEASPEYIKVREEVEKIDNDLAYLRAYSEIFSNSHIFYRQVSKSDGSL